MADDTSIAAPQTQGAPAGSPPMLRVEQLSKTYSTRQRTVRAIDLIDFHVREGEFVSIVGPSGCGKSTLLSCLAGLLPLSSGAVYVSGKKVSGPPADLSIVFQDSSRTLFPWLSVESNIALPVAGRGKRAESRRDAQRLIDAVGLPPEVAEVYPWQLSGGMQQRVAIARALVSRPKALLMDEPFASVDAQTRTGLEELLLAVWQQWKKTVLFVTHDIDEAVYLSDRVLVLSPSPSKLIAEIDVPLPRPRDQLLTKQDPVYAEIRAQIFHLVMDGSVDRLSSTGTGRSQLVG